MTWSWMLPEPASTFGPEIDSIYYLILWITGAIFVLTEVALVWFLFRYRHREGHRAEYSHGSKKAEIVWTVIPFIIVLFIAFKSNEVWLEAKQADRNLEVTENALPLRVVAKQFEWNVTYPGHDGELDTADDFEVRNQLHLPVDRPIRIELESEDVIHSFFVPRFRVKQDAVPGMTIPVWFQATETGEYTLGCAELCGLGHYRMRASVTVHDVETFDRWVDEQAGGPASAESAPVIEDEAADTSEEEERV